MFINSTVAQSIAQLTRYFTVFYSKSLHTAQHVQHYIKEPLISWNILLTQ